MPALNQAGKNLNDDIAALVEEGLPRSIQQAADSLRVVGNNAVHPGSMDLDDDPSVFASLFDLINLIVENRIAEPARVQAIFDRLPPTAHEQIEKRDGTAAD